MVGVLNIWFKCCVKRFWWSVQSVILVCAGRGRPQIPLQEQVLMLLHFVAHKGKYGLLADKFGITRSCYFSAVDELLDIVSSDMLRRHIYWPNPDRQKETADYFCQRYGFPGVVGAIDGTHVSISKPPGSQFSEDYFSVRKKLYTMLLQVCVCKNSGPYDVAFAHFSAYFGQAC